MVRRYSRARTMSCLLKRAISTRNSGKSRRVDSFEETNNVTICPMTLSEELKARGLIVHSSAALEEVLGRPRTVYIGIDPTADSAHIGHLVFMLKRLGDAGHKLVFLVG